MSAPANADPPADWAHVLDELWGYAHDERVHDERGVEPADAEEAIEVGAAIEVSAAGDTWVPPEGIGPVPQHLLDRAVEVRDAQSRAIASVRRAMDEVASELSAVRSAPPQGAPSEPIYLDRLA